MHVKQNSLTDQLVDEVVAESSPIKEQMVMTITVQCITSTSSEQHITDTIKVVPMANFDCNRLLQFLYSWKATCKLKETSEEEDSKQKTNAQ